MERMRLLTNEQDLENARSVCDGKDFEQLASPAETSVASSPCDNYTGPALAIRLLAHLSPISYYNPLVKTMLPISNGAICPVDTSSSDTVPCPLYGQRYSSTFICLPAFALLVS